MSSSNNKLIEISSLSTRFLLTVFELLISISLTVIIGPILIFLLSVNELIRIFITIIFKLQFLFNSNEYPQMKLVDSGSDGIWGFTKKNNSRNILILYIYNSRLDVEIFKRNYVERVLNFTESNGNKPFMKLTNIFKKKFGYFCWEKDHKFNIGNHVKTLFGEDQLVTESELFDYMSTLTIDMNEDVPQWEELIIPRFVYDNDLMNEKSARIWRSHHSYMDGCSSLVMSGICMGEANVPFPYVIDPLAPLKISTWMKVFYTTKCFIVGIFTTFRSFIVAALIKNQFIMDQFSGNVSIGWSSQLNLSLVHSIKEKTGCTIPSILATSTLGALASFKNTKTEIGNSCSNEEDDFTLGMVGAILPYPNVNPRNKFTVVNFQSNAHKETNRLKRLKIVHKDLMKLTRSADGLVTYTGFEIIGRLPAFLIQFLIGGGKTPIIYSNVPWAAERVSLWDKEVLDVAGWMPLLTTAGIGLLSATYQHKIRICIVHDLKALSKDEGKTLLNGIYEEIQFLKEEICIEHISKQSNP